MSARWNRGIFRRSIWPALTWLPVALIFEQNVCSFAVITGGSMQPTLNPDTTASHCDVVLLDRLSLGLSRLRRGDVVTFWSPEVPDRLTTKRIIALEGDLVNPLPPSAPTPVLVPPGHCWVEGDSTYRTRDSNTFGPIPTALVTAKIAYILWPWGRRGSLPGSTGKAAGRVKRLSRSSFT